MWFLPQQEFPDNRCSWCENLRVADNGGGQGRQLYAAKAHEINFCFSLFASFLPLNTGHNGLSSEVWNKEGCCHEVRKPLFLSIQNKCIHNSPCENVMQLNAKWNGLLAERLRVRIPGQREKKHSLGKWMSFSSNHDCKTLFNILKG